jgi:hypothetical protein
VQLSHAISGVRHANENRGRDRDKGFDLSQRDFEWLHLPAVSFENLKRRWFATGQQSRRQKSDVGRQVGKFRMQLPAEVLYELSHLVPYVSH